MTATEKSHVRGRPRRFDRTAAVETAMRLFHAKGYDAVGVAELGQALGINPPSFYAAFGSKAGLFKLALEHYFRSEANIFARAQEKGGPVAAVIERTLLDAARIYPMRDGVAGCLVLDGARNSVDPEVRAITAEVKEASRGAVRDFIATAYQKKADDLATLVIVALNGMSASARDGMGEADLRRFAEAAARAFRREAEAR